MPKLPNKAKTKVEKKRIARDAKNSKYSHVEEEKHVEVASDSDEYGDETGNEYTKEMARADLRRIQETEDIYEIIELTRAPDAQVRLKATQQMCPCRVKDDIPEFWERIFELAMDEDANVRYQVMHNMCDGSPSSYEYKVEECLEIFNRDPDNTIRRKATQVLSHYHRTGKWNVM